MKVIDLLNKTAKGEEVPEKIRIDHWCYEFEWVEHLENYYDKNAELDLMEVLSMSEEELNYGVEIIEEDEFEYIKELANVIEENINYEGQELYKTERTPNTDEIVNKINELVKAVNKLKNK